MTESGRYVAVGPEGLRRLLGSQCSPMVNKKGYVVGPDVNGRICHCSSHFSLVEAETKALLLNTERLCDDINTNTYYLEGNANRWLDYIMLPSGRHVFTACGCMDIMGGRIVWEGPDRELREFIEEKHNETLRTTPVPLPR